MSYFSQLISKDFFLQKALDGKAFYTHEEVTVAGAGTREFLISTGANKIMVFANFQNDDAATVDVFKGTTVSANGTALTIENIDIGNAATPNTSIYHSPTITGDGTLIEEGRIFTATNIPMFISPARDLNIGWILDTNSLYLIRFTNDSGGNEEVLTSIAFFQLP